MAHTLLDHAEWKTTQWPIYQIWLPGYFRTLLILNDFELQPATTVSDFLKLDHPWILETIVSPNDATTIRNRWFGCDHHGRNFYCDTEVQRPSSQQRYAHPTWEVLTAEFYSHKKSTKTHSFAKFSRHIFLHGLVDMPHCLLVQICPNSRIPCQNSSPKRRLVTPASRMQRVIIILQTCTEKRLLISASYPQSTPMANTHSCLDAT